MKKTNAMRILDSKKINYKIREYEVNEDDLGAVAAAAKTGTDIDIVFKTLVLKGDKTGYIVACIGGAYELNLKTLAKVSGNKKIEMIQVKDIQKLTGYIRGGCSPIGMKKQFPTYIDSSASIHGNILISGGKRGLQIEIDPQELKKIVKAEFVDITL